MGTLEKIQRLYQQLDRNISAGEDVVADLRKEINNLELSYLKDEVMPQVVNLLGSKIKHLRCELDCSIQFNEEKQLNYTFCTSGSTLMIKNSVLAAECCQRLLSSTDGTGSLRDEHKNLYEDTTPKSLRIVDYSEKAIVVYGDSRHLAEIFKERGGYFNAHLKEGTGWVFSKNRREEIEKIINQGFQRNVGKLSTNQADLFSASGISVTINAKNNINVRVSDDYLSGFKNYLLNAQSKHGVSYSLSTVRVYVGGLKNNYIQNLIEHISSDGLLDSVNIGQLELLDRKVKYDASNGNVANFVSNAFRLYIDYRKSLIENFQKVEYPIYSTIIHQKSKDTSQFEQNKKQDKFIRYFDNLKTIDTLGIKGPHKAILLIAIFECYKEGVFTTPIIPYNSILESKYSDMWRKYMQSPLSLGMGYPFIQLSEEPFFFLDVRKAISTIDQVWNRQKVLSHIKNGRIAEDLFNLLSDRKMIKEFTSFLINRYCKNQGSSNDSKNNLNEPLSRESSTKDLITNVNNFKDYLRLSNSSLGRKYSESTIAAYSSSLSSLYIQTMVKAYDLSGNIFNLLGCSVTCTQISSHF